MIRREVSGCGGILPDVKAMPRTELRDFLAGTARRVLVEASPTDRIRGIGLAATDDRSADPAQWRGLNPLGFALMEARERLT